MARVHAFCLVHGKLHLSSEVATAESEQGNERPRADCGDEDGSDRRTAGQALLS